MIKFDEVSPLPPEDNLGKKKSKKQLKKHRKALYQLQKKLWANKTYSILIIMQGQHTAGKNGSVRKAYRRMNPLGVEVASFKEPTEEEKRHDFLWRIYPHFPEDGMIKVFNRSYYEDIIVPSVKDELDGEVLQHRINMINKIEQHLMFNKTLVIKIYLHISAEEQQERIDGRKHKRKKQWKYKPKDEKAAGQYQSYNEAYEKVLNNCNNIPWHIVPADKRWHRDMTVAEILRKQLEALGLEYPVPEILEG